MICTHPKLIILRTLSKAFDLAGLRIGFALTNKDLIKYCRLHKVLS
ncbi:aminotransferase class I/II-fold pyridoxal phosphate-dependent enzyme [Lactovum miscens]